MSEFSVKQIGPLRKSVLERIVKCVSVESLHILEIGSFEGASALHWAQLIRKHKKDGSVTCVDPWRPYLYRDDAISARMDDELCSGAALDRFLRNTASEPYISHFVGDVAGFSKSNNRRGEYDIIFVDGNHIYERVMEDLRVGASMLRDGGILCGDDYDAAYPGVIDAAQEFFSGVWSSNGVFAMRKTGQFWTVP